MESELRRGLADAGCGLPAAAAGAATAASDGLLAASLIVGVRATGGMFHVGAPAFVVTLAAAADLDAALLGLVPPAAPPR